MSVPLVNQVKGEMRRGLRPNITFQDALGARLTQQQQRQGGQHIRMPRSYNNLDTKHHLSQSNTHNPTRFNSLSSSNPYNHTSQSQSRPISDINTNHYNYNINNNNGGGFIPHYNQSQHGQSNGRYSYDPYGYPYGQQQPIHHQSNRKQPQNRSSRSQMSPVVRSGYNNTNNNINNNINNNNKTNNRNNNNNNNNNNKKRNTNRRKKTKSRTQKQKTNSQPNNNYNNNTTPHKQKQKQQNKNSDKSAFNFDLHELGYASDDSIVDDLISAPKFNNKEEEKDAILEESMEDDEMLNKNKNSNINENNKKTNINRRSLLFDRATNGWYDKNDRFYKFKKLFNDMTSCTDINTTELPKIIIKNVGAVNWSYNDVHIALAQFIQEMNRIGNKKWKELKASDIIDYRVHIP